MYNSENDLVNSDICGTCDAGLCNKCLTENKLTCILCQKRKSKQTQKASKKINIPKKYCLKCNVLYKSQDEVNWTNCDTCGDSRLCGECSTASEFTCKSCILHIRKNLAKSR
jgi:hypothetical protein